MKFTSRFITNTYFVKEDIYIEIVTDFYDRFYDAFIFHVDFGVKFHMFGVDFDHTSFDGFVELVEANIDDYLEILEEKINE